MSPAFLLGPLFLVLVICLHHRAPAGKKLFGHVASALALLYRSDLGYRYEVTVILVDWLVLIVSGVLLSRSFLTSAFSVAGEGSG